MAQLWKDFDGEPFLVNPHLVTINPRRKRKTARLSLRNKRTILGRTKSGSIKERISFTAYRSPKSGQYKENLAMPKRSKRTGRFIKGNAASNPRRKRRSGYMRRRAHARRNPYFMGNAPARRRSRRRSYRRNPAGEAGMKLFGITLPPFDAIGFSTLGFVAPPMVEGFFRGFMPLTFTETALGRYTIKIGSVLLLAFGADALIGRRAARYIGLGGATYIAANLVTEFMPTLFGTTATAGYMNPGRTFPRAVPRMGAQPFIGRGAGVYRGAGSYETSVAPARLQPESRF